VIHNAVKVSFLISHNHQELHPMHTAIPKRNLKTVSVPNRAWSVAAGEDFLARDPQCSESFFA